MMVDDSAREPQYRYNCQMAGEIELKWQAWWDSNGTFNADNPTGPLAGAKSAQAPWFVMDMFPYPSGAGLHVGHPLGYIATDTMARFQRMQGKNVLYTLGFDAFGLPAEQYAIQTGLHPRITTESAIENMSSQLRRIGLSHDRRRSFATIDDEYVRWTQWIFLQIFNSWYDTDAENVEGTLGRARPIDDLIAQFEEGIRPTPSGQPWGALDAVAKSLVLDQYRLAYISESPVNWCPGLGTVLANEEVTAEGRSERGNFPVFTRSLRQWNMRITAYSDRLVEALDYIDWPEKVRSMQRHWIGKSTGASVAFQVDGHDDLQVFTTRPDTLFGATFMVVAPEHPLLNSDEFARMDQWPDGTRDAWTGGFESPAQAVSNYQKWAGGRTDVERQSDGGEKTGVFTGHFGINPVNGSRVPVFVSDYVLMGYGTGAIMAVPAHDERDFAFAKRFELDIIPTIKPAADFDLDAAAWTGDGVIVNSANSAIDLNGLNKAEAIARVTDWLVTANLGQATTTYRLRDWLFSRQRYWGEPFPIVYGEDGRVHALPQDQLPVTLPHLDNFSPRTFAADDAGSSPETPLGRATDWLTIDLDLGEGLQTYHRDTNTMPNWAGSCFYELRYIDPTESESLVRPENDEYWMGPRADKPRGGVDLYVGGVEHAVLHLLYARFWQKALFDLGHVSAAEPFHTLFNQGYIQAFAYTDARGVYVPAEEVIGDEQTGFSWNGETVNREYGKMGKSLKNSVTPDEMCETYGADTFRLYEMSMGPLDLSRPWDTRAVVGAQRFLQRLWRNIVSEETNAVTVSSEPADKETQRLVAKTIADVTEEYANLRINTAISRMIVLNNHLTQLTAVPLEAVEPLILLVAPVAPHIAEELWQRLGHTESLATIDFPVVTDESLLVQETVTCVVQVNGKLRAKLEVNANITEEDLRALALAADPIAKHLGGREPMRVIVRAPKLVNVVPARD